ncbi:MAG: hypothetical protein NZ777_10875 [Pseudomonadales bacterium]|nr:hypothetical protein [Pseudomonadales bacterium]
MGQLAGCGGDALEQVVDEAVHDGHRLAGDLCRGAPASAPARGEDKFEVQMQYANLVDGAGLPPLALVLLLVTLGAPAMAFPDLAAAFPDLAAAFPKVLGGILIGEEVVRSHLLSCC